MICASFYPDENMQVTRHSYTMKYLLGLALGKWIVSHHCKSNNNQYASETMTVFIPYHRKYSQSECGNAVVCSSAFHRTFPSSTALILEGFVFSMVWYKIFM